jgi:apolipoprotein D and lipocalin family protein
MKTLFLVACVLAVGSAGARPAPAAGEDQSPLLNDAVPVLDLGRYAGEWHEIAHLPMFFQRKCVANITAIYTPRPDGTIGVRNACDARNGKRKVAEGTARPVAGHPGRLEVRFVPDWLAWAPGVWADYWVVELDPQYEWAVVGGPSRESLWILSRKPAMKRATYEAIRARAARRAYPGEKLVLPANTLE